MVTITSVEVAAGPDKTEYTEGETLDPTGLVLRVIYSDGSDGTIGYNAGTADWFDFKPDLGTALTTDIKEVAVTYQHHTANFTVTVNEKDPGTDPEPGDPDPDREIQELKPEDPQNPGTDSSQNGDKGQSGNGDKLYRRATQQILLYGQQWQLLQERQLLLPEERENQRGNTFD